MVTPEYPIILAAMECTPLHTITHFMYRRYGNFHVKDNLHEKMWTRSSTPFLLTLIDQRVD